MKAFVYALRINGAVRYIGKGRGRRIEFHMTMVRRIARQRAVGEIVKTTKFYNRLTKVWLAGSIIEAEILANNLSDEDAFDLEIKEIASRKNLWNGAPGGNGFTSEQCKIVSLAAWRNPQIREARLERFQSKEYRDKIKAGIASLPYKVSGSVKGSKKRDGVGSGISERAKARWQDPEFREKMIRIFRSPEFRAKRRELATLQWSQGRGHHHKKVGGDN